MELRGGNNNARGVESRKKLTLRSATIEARRQGRIRRALPDGTSGARRLENVSYGKFALAQIECLYHACGSVVVLTQSDLHSHGSGLRGRIEEQPGDGNGLAGR